MASPHQVAGVKPGDILAGKYLIDRILGAGGMGVVVAAHHTQLDEKVAIKFLLPSAVEDETTMARFAQEARAAVKIKSEHVARVFDVGTLDNGYPYMVLEFLEGIDLSGWLEKWGPLSVELAVDFVLQACEALAEAHGLGIVHRDLKPSNLFIVRGADGGELLKVLDFGISKITPSSAIGVGAETSTHAVLGSPLYMSPEQMTSSRNVDFRTDIWSMGVILYELLTAKRPFTGDSLPEVCVKVTTEQPPNLEASRPDVPRGIERLILTCLAKRRERRYQNVAELALALAEFASQDSQARVARIVRLVQHSGQGIGAQMAPGTFTGTTTGTTSSWVQTNFRKKTARRAALGVLGVFLAAAALTAGIALRRPRRDALDRKPTPVVDVSAAVTATSEAAPSSSVVAGEQPRAATSEAMGAAANERPDAAALLPVSSRPANAGADPKSRPSNAGGKHPSTSSPRPSFGAPLQARETSPSLPTAPPAAPNCDPPFTIDNAGIKHPKRECL